MPLLVSSILLFYLGVVFAYFSFLHSLTPLRLGYEWWVWAAALLADDFCYYWFHRMSHEVRLLWAAHVNHHSSRKYNLSTALRQTSASALRPPKMSSSRRLKFDGENIGVSMRQVL